jgi:hypothetical protein
MSKPEKPYKIIKEYKEDEKKSVLRSLRLRPSIRTAKIFKKFLVLLLIDFLCVGLSM